VVVGSKRARASSDSSSKKPVTGKQAKTDSKAVKAKVVSSDDSSDDSDDVKPPAKAAKKVVPVAKKSKKDSSSDSDSSEEDVKVIAKVAAKKTEAKKVAKKDSSSDSDSSDSDKPAAKKAAAKVVAKKAAKKDSSSDSDSDDSDKPAVRKQSNVSAKATKKAAAKDSSDDEEMAVAATNGHAAAEEEFVGDGQKECFIGNLSFQTSEDGLRRRFQKHGNIVNFKMPQRDGRPTGIAFIEFATPAEAKKAIDNENGAEFDGRNLKVNFSGDKPEPRAYGGNGNSGEAGEATTLFCGNLGFRTTEDGLAHFFSECGEVKAVRIAMGEDGRPKGFAHVEFTTPEAATKAVALNG
jgi:nucleolin